MSTHPQSIHPRSKKGSLLLGLVLSLGGLASATQAQTVAGPNILVNSGFEAGKTQWQIAGPFSVEGSTAAHSGTSVLKAALAPKASYKSAAQKTENIWPDTKYVSSVWVTGTGTVTLEVISAIRWAKLGATTVRATPTWQQVSLPWNSGSSTAVNVQVTDSAGGNKDTVMLLDDLTTGLADAKEIAFNTADPAASGFQLRFADEFRDDKTIDTHHTSANGFHWYEGQFFNGPSADSSMYEIDPNGGLLVKDCPNRWGSTIHTTEPDSANGKGFHGTVFSIGSGVYFESKIAMMNPKKIWNNAWPAFWSTDMKLDTGMHKEMAGNPGKYEYIEDDFMEYNPVWRNGCAYNSTVHDWHGITGGTGATLDVNNGNAVVPCPVGTDFTQPHTYGVLWVPATAKNGWIGYREAFFDGVPEGAVCYRGNQAGTYPPSGSYAFSLKDHDQFEVILGASHGGTPTMKVDYVHVYAVDPSSVTVVPAGQAAAASPPGH